MKIIVVFLILKLTQAQVPKLDGKIVGGKPVRIEEFPYQLSLISNGEHICGASIISDKYTLTASHCVEGSNPEDLSVRAGSTYRTTGGTIHHVSQIFMHPKFDSGNLDYDYAVIELKDRLALGQPGIEAIQLSSAEISDGIIATVSGWGTMHPGDWLLPNHLQAVQVPIVNRNICAKDYERFTLSKRMICAGYKSGGKDSCQGDSGGPLVVNGKQIGIVSWGYGCADPGFPGVYSDVAKGIEWIKQITDI